MRANALPLHLFRQHSIKKRRSRTHAHLIKVSEGIASVLKAVKTAFHSLPKPHQHSYIVCFFLVLFYQGETVFPSDGALFDAARYGMHVALRSFGRYDTGYFWPTYKLGFVKEGVTGTRQARVNENVRVRDILRTSFENGAEDFLSSRRLANSLDDAFVVACLNDREKCNPFPFSSFDILPKYSKFKSNDFDCVEDRGEECRKQIRDPQSRLIGTLYVVYFIYTRESGSGPNKLEIPNNYQWCLGAHFRFDARVRNYDIKDRRILCGFTDDWARDRNDGFNSTVDLFQSSMIDKMESAVDSVKQEVEACFLRECGLDTKVGDL